MRPQDLRRHENQSTPPLAAAGILSSSVKPGRIALHLPKPYKYATLARVSEASEKLEHIFREEYGRIIATLIRISGSFDLAEESLQEAFALASARWPAEGIPRNPGAWLTTVSHRKLLDTVRRQETQRNKQPELEYVVESSRAVGEFQPDETSHESEYPDDRLRLIFTCCHPSLSAEAQVALTLRTLGGLTTTEIAHA